MSFADALKRQAVIARVSNIPVRADYRWFLVVILMSGITAASVNQLVGNVMGSVALGLIATLLFFASIFLHEFAHALAARLEKLDVVEIVLHPFGGLTRFRNAPETPRAEFRVAIAGPAASFVLTLLFLALMAAASAGGLDILAILFFLLALSNFLVAVFNLFPGYPLDGGRVLRAYLWRNGKDLAEATILTGMIGKFIAGGLIVLGLFFVVLYAQFFAGFWAVLAGLFLYDSARGIIAEVKATQAVLVDDVMLLPVSVDPDTTLQQLIDEILPQHRRTVFPVARERQLFGMLLLKDLKKMDAGSWRDIRIRDVMRGVMPDQFVETGSSFAEAQAAAAANGCGAVAVIDHAGRLVGYIPASGIRIN